tara:strand:- start:194 stop:565 length:372 start_codon:yes stop_codon:yes gene_type:complete
MLRLLLMLLLWIYFQELRSTEIVTEGRLKRFYQFAMPLSRLTLTLPLQMSMETRCKLLKKLLDSQPSSSIGTVAEACPEQHLTFLELAMWRGVLLHGGLYLLLQKLPHLQHRSSLNRSRKLQV